MAEDLRFNLKHCRSLLIVYRNGNLDWCSKIGIDYFINDDTMTYVSFSQGFKSGGFESPLVQ